MTILATETLPAPARRWRVVTLCMLSLLAMWIFAWQLLPTLTLSGAQNALVYCLPLLLPVWGIARGRRYTYRWATLCVMPYFIVGMTEVVANPAVRGWAAGMLMLALALFAALIGFLRADR